MVARCTQGVAKVYPRCSQALGRLMSMLRVWLEYAWKQPRVWLEYAYSMPRVCLAYAYTHLIWEPAISVRARRTGSPLPTDQESAPYGLFLTLLLLISGVVGSWADGYEGTWYIGVYGSGTKSQCASENPAENFYLCPTEGWCYYDGETNNTGQITNEVNDQPFLTSFKCRNGVYDATKAVWTIEKASGSYSNYYYIKQTCTGRYWVFNKQLNGAGANRARVHLETITPSAEDPNTYALFEISTVTTTDDRNGYYLFHPKEASNGFYLNITEGNVNSVSTPTNGRTDGPTGYKNVGGIVGQWNQNNNTSSYKLEPYSPFITFNANNQVEIKAVPSNATLVYTTDKSDPTVSPSNGTAVNTNTVSFAPGDDVTTIKAIAIVNGVESAVATFTPPALLGSDHKRLIQSQNNAWNTTDFHFYMIPGDEENSVLKVNTTSLFRPTMEWHLLYAGKDDLAGDYLNQYYYIVNSNDKYLCYDANNIVYMDTYSDNSDKFKFQIVESATAGTYNIIPYAQRNESGNTIRFVYKPDDGNNKCNANAKELSLSSTSNAHSQWKFVQPSTLDKIAPFTVSDASTTFYYKINSVGSNGFYIVPPSGTNTNATTSNSTDDNVIKTGAWYFEMAQEANETDWCSYYHIRNAETGKYLYFNKEDNNAGACLIMKETIEIGDEDKFMFTWAKTAATEANYYIIPKLLKDKSLNKLSALQRDNGTLKTNLTRGAGNYAWTFTPAPLFCNDPVFEEEEGVIKIKCNTNAAKIYINTESDTNPTDGSTLYNPTQETAQNWATTDQVRIKAIAIVSDGASPTPNTASSAVVTLLNKPDVTLTTASYEYNGTAQTFEKSNIAEVFITANEVKTTADASTYDIDTFENNITAGTPSSATPPTVKLKDVAGDNWFIWNASKSFTITPKALTITADSESKDYDGTELTKNSYTNTDLADGDAITSVTVTGSQIVVGTSANVPSAAVIKKGEEDRTACYEITYTNGTLEVTKKAVTITADSDTKVYDGTELTKNSYTNTDLADGDAITSVTVTGSQTVVGSSANEPSAAVIKKGEEDRTACYEITYTNGTLEVTKKAVTITADSDTKVYDGTALTKNTYTNTALADGDAITSVTVTGSQTDVGSSANVPSAAVIKKDTEDRTSCYEITYTNGTLTVTGIGVTVTADNKSKEYSKDPTTDPTLTATVTGLVGTDVITYTISRAAGEDVNDYVITPTGESKQGNYTVTYVPGTFTITPATLTITPNDGQTKEYGDADPAFTFTPTGLKGTDAIADVVQGTLTRAEGENRGTYAFNQGTLAIATGNNNYTLAYANPNNYVFTISQKPLTSTGITINIDESTNPITVVVTHAKSDGDYILSQKESETDPEYDYSLATVGEGDPGYNPNYFKTRISGNGNYSGYVDIRQAIVHFTTDANQAEWSATFVAEKAGTTDIGHVLPEGIAAYIISGIEGSWAIPEPLEYIPADVPVLLVTHEAKNGFLVKDASNVTAITPEQIAYNKLKRVTAESAHFNTKEIYVLYKNEFVLNKEGDLAKGKVYMENPNYDAPSPPSSPAPASLSIAWGNVTGIEDGRWKMDDGRSDRWYTLDGRCLIGKPTAKGLYIVNGKKRVVK